MRTIQQISKDLEKEIKNQKAYVANHGKESEVFKMAIETYSSELKKSGGIK